MDIQNKDDALEYFLQLLKDLLDELYNAIVDLESKGYKTEKAIVKGSTKILIVKKLLHATPTHFVMNHFEKTLLPVEEKLREKDEKFFLETPNLFPVPEEHILFIKDLWQNKTNFGFTHQQKETITEFLLCILESILAFRKF